MLNVKYLISKNLPVDDPDFVKVDSQGNSTLYESRYPLSIGYMTGTEIRTWDTSSDNPFVVLDNYVKAATSNRYDPVSYTHLNNGRKQSRPHRSGCLQELWYVREGMPYRRHRQLQEEEGEGGRDCGGA